MSRGKTEGEDGLSINLIKDVGGFLLDKRATPLYKMPLGSEWL